MAKPDFINITERELRDAYQASGLALRGWTFERAVKTALVREGLYANVLADRKKYQRKNGTPAPMQQALI